MDVFERLIKIFNLGVIKRQKIMKNVHKPPKF